MPIDQTPTPDAEAMVPIDPTLDDDAWLDQVLELALASRADGRSLALDELLSGREHLRDRAVHLFAIADDLAPVAVARVPDATLRQLPGYTILAEAGRGGMGIVYRARHEVLGRVVALKVLAPALTASASARERFAVEARALGRVHHAHVVAVYDVLADAELCAYAMEWIDGQSLAQAVAASGGGLAAQRVMGLGATLARALAAVHAEGLVHRDVKPSNVLLRRDGSPVLTDFSLVRDAQQSLHTATGEFIGTAAFAAPEQLRGNHDRIGPWTDVYALAATLYVALAGRPPFASSSTADLLRRIESGTRAPLRRLVPNVPRDLDTVLGKAMDPDPDRRYATAVAFAEDLERTLRHEPILARRTGLALRFQRFVERNPQLALALTGLLLVLGLGIGTTTSFALSLRTAERHAADEAEIQGQYAEFLRWVLRMGDAAGYGKQDMTVLAAVDEIAGLDDAAVVQRYRPELQHLIRMIVAETYTSVGRHQDAQRQLTAARQIVLTRFGATSKQAAEVAFLLGRTQRQLDQLDDAEASLREAVRIRRTLASTLPREFAQALGSLAIVLRHRQQFAEAEALYEEALAIYRRELGPENENVGIVLGNLASLRVRQGRLAAAEQAQSEALAILRSTNAGQPDYEVAHAEFKLGDIQFQTGRTVEGEAAMRAGLAMTESLTGRAHQQVAGLSARLATLLAACKPADAEILFRTSLAVYGELGSPVQACAQGIALADLMLAQDRPRDADATLVVALGHATGPAQRPEVLRRLGLARCRLLQFADAEASLEEAWSLLAAGEPAARKATAQGLSELYAAWNAAAPDPARAAGAAHWSKQAALP